MTSTNKSVWNSVSDPVAGYVRTSVEQKLREYDFRTKD
jgi:hypothetical protein